MRKYWVKNYFAHGSFPEVGQKQKTEKKEEKKDRKLVITMAKLRMAHASCLGQFSASGVSLKWVKSKRQKRKEKKEENTPGTAGGPGGRDRTLAVKSRKAAENQLFFLKK